MRRQTLEATLAVGFLAVAVGLLFARANPATVYESSIYAGTPVVTWIGFGVGLAIAVGTTLLARGRSRAIGIALGGTVVTSIVSLPLIRNYRFSGMGDAMTHLGWTRDLVGGELAPHDLFYPAVHSFGSVFHFLGGIPIERALMLTMVVLFVPFLLFVPLTVRAISGNATAVGLAAIVSWLILPVNNVATHMGVHTNSNALFVVPVILFALVAYIRRPAAMDRLPFGISPFSILVYLSGIALLLVHPQQMINVVVLVAAVATVQFLARYRFADHPIVDHPTTYLQTVVLGTIVTVWALSNERFRNAAIGLVEGLLAEDVGAAAEVGEREAALTEIGGSLGELFVVMFLDAAVIGLLVGLFVLATWLGLTQTDRETRSFLTYFALALVPLGGMFVLYFVGTPTMAFRQVGFIFVVLTILAGIALAHVVGGLSRLLTRPGATALSAVVLAGLLVLALATVFGSPIIYDPGQHVSDQTYGGYENTLEHGVEDQPLVGLGYDPFRYDHAINGLEGEESLTGGTVASGEVEHEPFEAGNYSGAYHDLDYYLAVTAYDVTREVEVYDELYYSESGVAGLEADPAVNRVISNGEFELYDVTGSD
ncbi:hypothetical protein [Natrarchaeobaculum aegyptiacum]|uniref:Glycosyltransferase RgtA/B/C/D-like domain-containing protein n=1 Tax=Natrarchaeobaculum aegyptiacum TaxID=745377 RepID=A0A2Z2HZA2_9EURY|nr:hypothetical protein [Natrarchaeobaculum aegyptiacum]ARS91805.1 hypothetical protein B1756_10835 [Natrarchaeobaculum aegyptiacum]